MYGLVLYFPVASPLSAFNFSWVVLNELISIEWNPNKSDTNSRKKIAYQANISCIGFFCKAVATNPDDIFSFAY